jgi:hypothetical protein
LQAWFPAVSPVLKSRSFFLLVKLGLIAAVCGLAFVVDIHLLAGPDYLAAAHGLLVAKRDGPGPVIWWVRRLLFHDSQVGLRAAVEISITRLFWPGK